MSAAVRKPRLGGMGRMPWAFSFAGALAIFAATVAFTGGTGAGQILTTALTFATMYVIVGLGQMFVVTTGPGNVDLSIPATIALAGTIAMVVMDGRDALVPLGLAAALGTGIAVGCFNYALIRLLSIPPIIATLSASFLVQSVAIAYGRGLRVRPPEGFAAFTTGRVAGIPYLAIATLALCLVMAVLLHRTVYGRSVSAIGQNSRAAGLAGIRVDRVRFLTYVLSAALAGLCGAVLAGFSGGSSLNMGEEYLLASIAVVVVGGSSVSGGQSNVAGLWGASLFLYLLVTMLNTFGVGAGLRLLLTGLIIIAIITIAGGPKSGRA
ncbi:ABC transporter permease [Aureimonas endophytica]|uniref:Autoinducer 2 import system permease protein LsrD n=1 Tax=Aureimonas endophytica TaxID=2027858 RepID=A0A917EDW6_9HYPH|nr:ABC transporter permease [Aureimonas endophytica]GGE22513.1 ABC transporter permease [Aureimonas endophytica]